MKRNVLVLLAAGAAACCALPVGASASPNMKLCQHGGWVSLDSAATGLPFTSQSACNHAAARGGISSLVVGTQPIIDCGGSTCWGSVTGMGLLPNSTVTFSGTDNLGGTPSPSTVGPDGTISIPEGFLGCGVGWVNVSAVGTTSAGATITSAAVNAPC